MNSYAALQAFAALMSIYLIVSGPTLIWIALRRPDGRAARLWISANAALWALTFAMMVAA